MGNYSNDIKLSIQQLVDSQLKSKNIVIFGEVLEVDTTTDPATVTILNIKGEGSEKISNVKISVSGDNVVVPKIGSQVIVLRDYSDNSMYLSRVETVENMTIKVESLIDIQGTTMTITADELNVFNPTNDTKITFNEGLNGGLVQILNLTTKLNAYETAFNNLATSLTGWIPTGVPAADITSLKGIFSGWVATNTPFVISQVSDYENPNVNH